MRARQPEVVSSVDRDGIEVAYEVFGDRGPWFVFAPIDVIVNSNAWKGQVPYLSRYARVVTIDSRGNGRSSRPLDPAAYADQVLVDDIFAVMDAVGAESAILGGICGSAWLSLIAADQRPERVLGVVAVAPHAPSVGPARPQGAQFPFNTVPDTDEGWAKLTRTGWERDYPDFIRFFVDQLLPEPHSTKQFEDFVSWTHPSGEVMLAAADGEPFTSSGEVAEALLRRVACPVLVVHGTEDRCQLVERGQKIAELTRARALILEGAGHLPMAREPVPVNRAIRDFVVDVTGGSALQEAAPPTRWTVPRNRPQRALYLSSPIGLGHARRDLAVVRALREQVPGLEVDWLAQDPVTRFLDVEGERVHPASRWLASESAQFEECAGEHDLNAFQAVRQMDEILLNNFMVFADLVEEQTYDLWTGDEAWDVDHFLHENPELKRTAYAWLTDFVGWLPMPDDDPRAAAREAELTADYNAEMLEQIARLPRVRDRALFVGNPEDVVDADFGPGMPRIRDWVEAHYDFTGFITGFDPADVADRDALRAEHGFGEDEKVCVVAVGGSGVGSHLLRRTIEAHRIAATHVPGLRTVVVAGPRIDPASLPTVAGLEVHGFVPGLHRMLAASDMAVVQGGLSTTMELTAAGRPFVYVPLRHHFEQNLHVRHRLANYGAGTCLTWDEADPDRLAEAVVAGLRTPATSRPVETDGAQRAARALAELI